MRLKLPAWFPLLFLAVCFWVCAALFMSRASAFREGQCLAVGLSALLVCPVPFLLMRTGKSPVLFMGILGVLLALGVSGLASHGYHSDARFAEKEGMRVWQMRVVEDSKEGEFGASCVVRCRLSNGRPVKVRLNLPEGAVAHCWQLASVKGELRMPLDASFQRYWSKGWIASISPETVRLEDPPGILGAVSRLRERGTAVFAGGEDASRPSDSRVLMQAILFGDRRGLFGSDLYSVMKTVGLAHIVAVSGAHLVMVTGFFLVAMQALGIPKRFCVPFQLALVAGYACLTGIPVSVLRAAVMTCCALASFYARRAASSLSALALCAVGMIALDPFLALSVSLAMSVCAPLGIILLSRKLGDILSDLLRGRLRAVSDSLSVCLSANAFTLPVSVSTFGQLPLVSPLSNLIAVPVFPFLVCGGLLATFVALVFPGFADLAIFPVLLVAGLFCQAARLMALLPFACVPASGSLPVLAAVAVALAGAFLAMQGRVKSSWIAAGACVLVCAILVSGRAGSLVQLPRIVALDVGQGDAILLNDRDRAVLVDTGTDDAALFSGLARHGVGRIDAVVVTHPDDDHCGSLGPLLETVPVGRVCVPQGVLGSTEKRCAKLAETLQGSAVEELLAGDSFSVGCYAFHALSPARPTAEGGNEDSLVLIADADVNTDGVADWKVLLTGDAEAEVLLPLCTSGKLGDVDILKVPHHGSRAAVDERLLQGVSPEIALVSVGEKNCYGHPAPQVLRLLQECGAETFRTDAMGDVVCRLQADRVMVSGVK